MCVMGIILLKIKIAFIFYFCFANFCFKLNTFVNIHRILTVQPLFFLKDILGIKI